MIWMETFCFYCSVRLGVIVSAIYSMGEGILAIVLLAVHGSAIFKSTKNFIERDEQHSQDPLIRKILDGLSERTQNYMITFNVLLLIHMTACILAAYGALKLKKAYLMPYIGTQFVKFFGILTQHIITMVILKKTVNLGILIGLTLAGGFYILFVGYSWAGAVAQFQIIVLVNSQKYKALYGDDPMAPWGKNKIMNADRTIENVKIFLTPNNNDISAIKRKRLIEEQQQRQLERKVISVAPLDQLEIDAMNLGNIHWSELVRYKAY